MQRLYADVRPVRRIGRLALALAAAASIADGAFAQEIPESYEQGIFQLSIGDLPRSAIAVLVGPAGELLFPVEAVLRTAEVPFTADSAGYILSLIDSERHALVGRIDTVSESVSRGTAVAVAEEGEMVAADGDVYLSVRLLSHLLSAQMRADFSVLDLRIEPEVPTPAELALDAERRRQLAMIRAGVAAGRALPSTPLLPHSGAGVLHYSLSSAVANDGTGNSAFEQTWDATVLTLESGFALFGGLGVLGYTGSGGGTTVDPDLTFRYERYIPERSWISFVRGGDVFAEGAFFRSMRGLTVTNRPLRREGFFQDILVDPEVPPGYEIEVYQGGQLIAFSDRSSQDPLRVPITYGRTDLEVRMIAPSGEVVSTDLLYGVPQAQLPEDRIEYSAGAGACHFQDCELYYATADYGVRRWLTLGGGYEAEHDSLGFEHLPFARAILAPAGGWLGDARFVLGRQFSLSTQYNGTGPLTGNLGVDVRSSEVPRATLLPQSATRWDARGEIGYRRHRALGRLGGMEGEGVDRWALGYLSAIPRGIVMTQLESFAERRTELSLTAFQLLRRRLFGSSVTASGRVTTSSVGVRALEVGASGSWGNDFFANATIGWDRDASANLTLSFSRIFPAGQVAGAVSAVSGGSRATMRADGAVALDPFSALRPAAYTGIGFAGIDAFVFRDTNANGVHDDGESPAVGVVIQAGERSATSDSTGHARLWGVLPWEKTVVRASSDWFEPQWAPAREEVVIRPVAHVFNPIDVPLIATREFIAYVVPGEGLTTTASVGYRLVSEATGKAWEGLTLSDGSIYISGLPVGAYLLELSPEALAFLRARVVGAPIRFTIPMEGDDEYVFELPPIELRRIGPN